MLEERNTQWKLACEDETTIPPFIRRIRNYATRLQVGVPAQILFKLHGIATQTLRAAVSCHVSGALKP